MMRLSNQLSYFCLIAYFGEPVRTLGGQISLGYRRLFLIIGMSLRQLCLNLKAFKDSLTKVFTYFIIRHQINVIKK